MQHAAAWGSIDWPCLPSCCLLRRQLARLLQRSPLATSPKRPCKPKLWALNARVQGVVHGALGSGSVMLSTFDDRSAARLVVKLDNVSYTNDRLTCSLKDTMMVV